MTVTTDSTLFKMTFYGILNANGAFWTPLAFDSQEKAWQHIRDFWKPSDREWQGQKRHFKVVPVRIQLTRLEPAHTDPTKEKIDGE